MDDPATSGAHPANNSRRDVASEQLKMFASARAEAIKRKESEASPGPNAHAPDTQPQNLIVDTSAQISAGEPPLSEILTETTQSKDINADSSTKDFNGALPTLPTQAQRSESENINTETPAEHSDQVEINSDGVINDENGHSTPSALEANAQLENSSSESVPVAHGQQIEEDLTTSSPETEKQQTTDTSPTEIVMENLVPEDHTVIKSEELPWIPFEWNFPETAEPINFDDSPTSNESLGLGNLKRGRSPSFENELFVPETLVSPFKKMKVEPNETIFKKENTSSEDGGRSLPTNENSIYFTVSDDEEIGTINISDNDGNGAIIISDNEDDTRIELSDDEGEVLDDYNALFMDELDREINSGFLTNDKERKSNKVKKNKNDKPKKAPAKPRRKQAKTVKEGYGRYWDDKREKEKSRHPNVTSEAVSATKKASSKSSRKNAKSKAAKFGLLQSFAAINQIAEGVANNENNTRPEIVGSTKKNVIEQLLAACPESKLAQGRRDVAALDASLKRIGRKRIKPINDRWLLAGMEKNSALRNHQVIGVDWMVARELANETLQEESDGYLESYDPSGGMLCDTMGLGKTVEVLATMILNPPDSRVPEEQRATLIVVPPCVLWQWKREIEKHCEPKTFRRSKVYRAKNKEDIDMIELTDQNIVLTSYYDIRKSCPWPLKEIKNCLHQEDRKKKRDALKGIEFKNSKASMAAQDDETTGLEDWIEENREHSGYLHQIEWHRVILDEGHAIKNHQSRSSLAANALKARYRWIVSGTPCMNRLEELFSYFRFLKDPRGATTFLRFQKNFCDFDDEDCRDKLESALSEICIRRTMKDEIAGAPLVELEKAHCKTLKIKQPPAERVLYRAIWLRLIEMINENYHKSDPAKPLSYFLAQLQILRKATAHPLLVEGPIKAMFNVKKLEKIAKEIRDLQKKVPTMDMAIHDHILRLIDQKVAAGEIEDFKPEAEAPCEICYDNFTSENEPKRIPACKHVFCRECLESEIQEQLADGGDEPMCPVCERTFDCEKIQDVKLNKNPKKDKVPVTHKVNIKGKDSGKHRPGGVEELSWLQKFDNDEIEFPESAKTRALKQQLLEWSTNVPNEKMIIFSQWVPVYRIVGRILSEMGIPFVYYSGDMILSQRDQALQWFEKKPEVRVMVSGLKCGGLGLNLTCANHVISIDLWWNTCVENQAFGRVYRFGQSLETYFTRLVVQKTMDSKILEMQERKMRMVDATFKDLSQTEIAGLFGRVEIDKYGRMKIIPDFDDDDDDDPGIAFDDDE